MNNIPNSGLKPIPKLSESDISRFWSKVNKAPGQGPSGTCWEWTGTRNPKGYGHFHLRVGNTDTNNKATRIAYLLQYKKDPFPYKVLHTCDNPPCCRGIHLWKGSDKENMQDAVSKGRMASGDRHWSRSSPEKLKFGDDHWTHKHPELIKRGDESWSRNHKDRIFRKYTQEQVQELVELVSQIGDSTKVTFKEVAESCGFNAGSAWNILRKNPELITPELRITLDKLADRSGNRNPSAKITWEIASQIRQMKAEGESTAAISRELGLGYDTVQKVVLGITWKVNS